MSQTSPIENKSPRIETELAILFQFGWGAKSLEVNTIKNFFRSRRQFYEDFGRVIGLSLLAVATSFVWIMLVFARNAASGLDVDDVNLAPMAQVVSVLLAINLIVVGIQLTRDYDLSEMVAALKRLRAASQEPDILNRIQSNWPSRTRVAFRRSLALSELKEFMLRDPDNGFPYFTTRYTWDGVWYRIPDSPFSDLKADDQVFATGSLHEVLVCALEVLSVYTRMLDRGLFISNENRGVNGCIWCHRGIREFRIETSIDKSPILTRSISIEHARSAINLAVSVGFLVQYEMRDHEENLHNDPLRGAEFIKECAELLIWIFYMKSKLDIVRLHMIALKSENSFTGNLWDSMKLKEDWDETFEARDKFLELQNIGRNQSATRKKVAQLYMSSVLTVASSTMFLVVYALGAPIFHEKSSFLAQSLIGLSYFLGVTSVLVAVVFVIELIIKK